MTTQVIVGDCREILRRFPDEHFHCVVTSPPYFGLRDYKVPPLVWGGDSACSHLWTDEVVRNGPAQKQGLTSQRVGRSNVSSQVQRGISEGVTCRLCGAWRGCLGNEPNPDLYVSHLVECLEEVRRVLRNDGTLWLNIGDTMASKKMSFAGGTVLPKEQIGIPWYVAFSLRRNGWLVRFENIWHKTAAMPENLTDRPTRSHEQVFILTKSEKYFYDALAVAEPSVEPDRKRADRFGGRHGHTVRHSPGGMSYGHVTRNLRSVWTLGPEPYMDAHFAVFPSEIPRRAILAGTSERGCCPACGAGWRRVVEREKIGQVRPYRGSNGRHATYAASHGTVGSEDKTTLNYVVDSRTVGWVPDCTCHAGDPVPAVVLDPFAGSGRTLRTAAELGRNSVGIELSSASANLARLPYERKKIPRTDSDASAVVQSTLGLED